MPSNNARVLAVDPGYERLGLAVLEKNLGKEVLLFSTCLQTPKNLPPEERLLMIKNETERIIKEFNPVYLAIEGLFFSKNKKTALMVAEARGVVLGVSAENNIPVSEINPLRVKIAVTGYGRSKKTDVFFMVRKLVKLPDKKMFDDEIDAVAIGLAFLAEKRG